MKRSFIFLLFVFVFVASPVYAVDDNAEKRSEKNEKKELAIEQKCKTAETKIGQKVSKFNSGKTKYFNSYNNLESRLVKFEKRLSGKGYDTAKLKTDIAILSTKIDKFSEDYKKYLAELQESKSFSCGKSDGEFRGKLTEARALLKQVHQDSKEIKQYYHDVIRVDLQEIKKQTSSINQGNTNKNGNANGNSNANSNTNANTNANNNQNANTNSTNSNQVNE